MYYERLFACGSDPSRRLLDGDVLAMKTWGTTGLTEDAGHQKESSRSKHSCTTEVDEIITMLDQTWTQLKVHEVRNMPLDVHNSQKGCCCNLPALLSVSTGHIGLFSCCLLGNANSFPPSFFWIHILGGLVLFFSDGIVVSRISTSQPFQLCNLRAFA